MLPKSTLDFVIPLFNEGPCVPELVRRLNEFRKKAEGDYVTRFLLVNDGSTDDTWKCLLEATRGDDSFVLLNLSRNFGHQMAITAGLDHAEADYVVTMDADLQDPPETVWEMLAKASEGFDVVYATRRRRVGETFWKRLTAYCFYRLIQRLCAVPIPADTGDFRLVTRVVHREFQRLRESHRFIRGMVPWLGFRSAAVLYDRDSRYGGETKFSMIKMVRFAADAIFSFSRVPLQLASALGVFATLLSIVGAMSIVYLKLFTNRVVPGITVILCTVVFFGGVQLVLFGLMGEYVGRIFEQGKGRALYIVREVVGVSRRRDA